MADIPRDPVLKEVAGDQGFGGILQHLPPRPPAGTPQPDPGHEGN